jgi:putative DNA primase/helicase
MTRISSEWIERARRTPIENIIDERGIRLRGYVDRSGPCPRCGGNDRFAVSRRKQVFNCRGCGVGGDVIALVQFLDGCEFRAAVEWLCGSLINHRQKLSKPSEAPIAADLVASRSEPSQDREEAAREGAKAQWLWRLGQPIAGNPPETYLRKARSYGGPIPPTLRYLPPRDGREPALIAAFGPASESEAGALAIDHTDVRAVQLIKLRLDGSAKADVEPQKIVIGRGALGSPIVLAPPNDLLGLAICEGAEDALSVHAATGLGAWASGGAGRMPALADAVPRYVECVDIFGDDDGGRRYAIDLAVRLKARGFEIILKFVRAGAST